MFDWKPAVNCWLERLFKLFPIQIMVETFGIRGGYEWLGYAILFFALSSQLDYLFILFPSQDF